jgi:hypothetical protein
MCLVALLSWKAKIPAMFIVYSIIMGWAALSNGISILFGGEIFWLAFSLLQVYWMFTIVREYRRYRRLPLGELYQSGDWPDRLGPPLNETAIGGRFAIGGSILAALSFILFPISCLGTMLLSAIPEFSVSDTLTGFIFAFLVDLSVLALALSAAALFSTKTRRGLAIGGIVASALVLIFWLGLIVIVNLMPLDSSMLNA